MESLVHPTELSAWGRFAQARRLHRETNRSKNPDWYRPALALNCQLHLFAEGEGIATARLAANTGGPVTWTEVEPPELDADLETLRGYLANLRSEHLSGKARSLGIVLHLADEFAISEIAPLHEVPEDLAELKELFEEAPHEVIEGQGQSDGQFSFRFFPYPGTKNVQQPGAAIQISRKHQEFLRLFRDLAEETKFPVRTMGLSAPLVTLAGLPRIIPTLPEQPFCAVLSYSTFSVLAFFNAEGELLMLRSIRNHSSGVAPNVGGVVQTMSAALELADPASLVLPLSQKNAAGTIPYYTGFRTIDMLGLNNEHIARKGKRDRSMPYGHQAHDGAYVLSQRPDVILFGGVGAARAGRFVGDVEISRLDDFQRLYRVRSLPGGFYGQFYAPDR